MKKFYKIVSLLLIISLCVQFPSNVVKAGSATSPFVGEIRLIASNFAPKGWAMCDGQLLPLSQNTALFSILGTYYGGDGKSNFALPNLNGKVAIGTGQGAGLTDRVLGEELGEAQNTLLQSEMPMHNHGKVDLNLTVNGTGTILGSSSKGNTSVPNSTSSTVMAKGLKNERVYSTDSSVEKVDMKANTVQLNTSIDVQASTTVTGGSQPHNNMSPYLGLNYIICMQGVYPPHDGSGGSSGYIGEIRMFAGNFTPGGWALCQGQQIPISENDALFNLIGTTYGGDGENTFALPNLSGRMPVGQGQGSGIQSNYIIGEIGGSETVTLSPNQIPVHSHLLAQQTQVIHKNANMSVSNSKGNKALPEGNVLAVGSRNEQVFAKTGSGANLKADDIAMDVKFVNTAPAESTSSAAIVDVTSSITGGSQPHNNMMPSVAVNYIISLYGIYPSESGGGGDENFLGAISMFAFSFAPGGYAQCNGQLLPINQNQALFSLLGTYYGGNGQTVFQLPDLRGRSPIGFGAGFNLGQTGGEEAHTLLSNEMPRHIHSFSNTTTVSGTGTSKGTNTIGNSASPGNALLSRGYKNERIYSTTANSSMLNAVDVKMNVEITPKIPINNPYNLQSTADGIILQNGGGSQPHENRQPFLGINFSIALNGIFPSPN